MVKLNCERDLIEYINYGKIYENLILNKINTFIKSNKNEIVENETIEPSKFFILKIKDNEYSIRITSIPLRKGEIKHFYWIL